MSRMKAMPIYGTLFFLYNKVDYKFIREAKR